MRKKRRITRKELKTIYEIGYSFVRKVKFDHVSSFAGHAALFLLMSIFPMAMFCISIFSYLPIDIGRLTQYLLTIIPEGSLPLVNQILAEAYAGSTTIMTSFTMLVMLFCASKGVYAVIIGMNAVYGIRETRGTMLLYALAAAYVVIFFAAIGLMMILIVLGNNIFNWLLQFVPGMIAFDRLFRYGKYLCMLVFLLVFFLLVYMNVPDRRSKIRYEFFWGAFFYRGMAGILVGVLLLYQQFCELFGYIWKPCNGGNLYPVAVWHNEYRVCGSRNQCRSAQICGVWLQLQAGV